MVRYFRSSWPYLATGLLVGAVLITSQSWAGDEPPVSASAVADEVVVEEPEVEEAKVEEAEAEETDAEPPEEMEDAEAPEEMEDAEAPEEMDDELPPADETLSEDSVLLLEPGQVKEMWLAEVAKRTELEQVGRSLVLKAQAARKQKDDAQYEQLKSELRDVVNTQFESLETKRRQQVEMLEARLKSLRDILKQRAEHSEEIIDRRVKTLLGESDALDWNPKSEALGGQTDFTHFFEAQDSIELPLRANLTDQNVRKLMQQRDLVRQQLKEMQNKISSQNSEEAEAELQATSERLEALQRTADELREHNRKFEDRYRQWKETAPEEEEEAPEVDKPARKVRTR